MGIWLSVKRDTVSLSLGTVMLPFQPLPQYGDAFLPSVCGHLLQFHKFILPIDETIINSLEIMKPRQKAESCFKLSVVYAGEGHIS